MLIQVTSLAGVNAWISCVAAIPWIVRCDAAGVPSPLPRASMPFTVTVVPGAGCNTTSDDDALLGSWSISCAGYVPPAICTICPGSAAWKARLKLAQGAACVHAFESDPDVATKTLALPVGGLEHAAVDAVIEACGETFPAASKASTASV